jgi:hypothetical protein
MAAGRLSGGGPGSRQRPWLLPYAAWIDTLWPQGDAPDPVRLLGHLNRLAHERGLATQAGHPVRFVDAREFACGAGSPHGHAYETIIAGTGAVPTRTEGTGALHDLFNALAWLRFPRTKSVLNALQAAQIGRDGIGARRGAVRDAVTIFDENALIWACDDPAPTQALAAFDWPSLFAMLRAPRAPRVATLVFGHALLEKLEHPFKAITAHALPLALPGGTAEAAPDEVDAALAARWAASPPTARDFCPLPVMGLPGWCDDNERPGFYDDPAVFRGGRMRSRRAGGGAAIQPTRHGGDT